jgi:hypothetical protein
MIYCAHIRRMESDVSTDSHLITALHSSAKNASNRMRRLPINGVLSLAPSILCAMLAVLPGSANADTKPSAESREPVAWGLLSHSKGCVIFREYKKTKFGFWVVVVTSKSHEELQVVETTGYELDPKVWIENEENLNELQRRAMKDSIRYVKIQDKYSAEELEAARALCRRDSATG